ncbi:hypothetical protein NECAME_19286, partial [Necator americanus]
ERRPRMDIDKYRIHDLDSATEVRRGVAGQPMAIESCKNSNLLVLDHTSTVTVDDCTDCLIALAPCAGREREETVGLSTASRVSTKVSDEPLHNLFGNHSFGFKKMTKPHSADVTCAHTFDLI